MGTYGTVPSDQPSSYGLPGDRPGQAVVGRGYEIV